MTIVTLDFESFYSKDYSLTKLSEAEYILDDRFEAIMVSLKIGDQPSHVYVGGEIEEALAQINWERAALCAHNMRFDGAILAWRYGYVPKLYLDTLSMARAITHWVLGKSSLKAVSNYLELPPKGDEVVRAIGKRLADFTPDELEAYAQYCIRDNDNCYEIFNTLRGCFQNTELQLIDLILRMYILPQVQLDPTIIEQHLAEVRLEKQHAIEQVAGIDKEHFSSNQKFAELLTQYGVVVPTKISPTTGSEIPALARGDWDFKELCADPSQPPFVQALLATRRSVKSTIDETRAEALLRISKLNWVMPGSAHLSDQGVQHSCWAPVPLKFSGARTHRLSGDGGINFQNIRRGSSLRRALQAPDGYRIVHRDASQIEARMVAWMSWCLPLLDAFEKGRDVYSEFASVIYERTITKEDKLERFVGKTAQLGLGYSCGPARFRHMLFIGNGGVAIQVEPHEAEHIVRVYRSQYPEIPDLWAACNTLLVNMIMGSTTIGMRQSLLAHLPLTYSEDSIWLPNGLPIQYPKLGYSYTQEGREICYDDPYGGRRKIYGGKVCLGADTNVLTSRGWIIITDIITTDLLWDGDEWVSHNGVVCNGRASTITVDGVVMTPDHKVMTTYGWQHGETCEGYNRAPVWLPDCYTAPWFDRDGVWFEADMGDPLRLRQVNPDDNVGLLQRHAEVVRLSPVRDDQRSQFYPRNVEAPGVCSMALNGRPLQAADAPSMGELRGSRDHSLPRVALVRNILGRHGSDVHTRIDARAQGQRGWVFGGKLRVGNAPEAEQQHAEQRTDRDPDGYHDRSRGIEVDRHRPYHTAVPHSGGGEPVYDIVNAGPGNRFVVAGTDGPFIVHNCENISQALARIVVTDVAVRVYQVTGYHSWLSTHDSLDYCVPLSEAEDMDRELTRQFAIRPVWADELPLASDGGWGRSLYDAERGANQ